MEGTMVTSVISNLLFLSSFSDGDVVLEIGSWLPNVALAHYYISQNAVYV